MPRSANAARRCPRGPSQRRARRSRPSAIRKGPARTERDVTRHLYRSSPSAPLREMAVPFPRRVVRDETHRPYATRRCCSRSSRCSARRARASFPPSSTTAASTASSPRSRVRRVLCLSPLSLPLCASLPLPLPLPLPLCLRRCLDVPPPRARAMVPFVGPTTEPPRDRSPSTSARRRPPPPRECL